MLNFGRFNARKNTKVMTGKYILSNLKFVVRPSSVKKGDKWLITFEGQHAQTWSMAMVRDFIKHAEKL